MITIKSFDHLRLHYLLAKDWEMHPTNAGFWDVCAKGKVLVKVCDVKVYKDIINFDFPLMFKIYLFLSAISTLVETNSLCVTDNRKNVFNKCPLYVVKINLTTKRYVTFCISSNSFPNRNFQPLFMVLHFERYINL